jgi:DNA-binding HxlR family transcriptional regulator
MTIAADVRQTGHAPQRTNWCVAGLRPRKHDGAVGQTYGCSVELALTMLGGKWRVVVLARIKEGAQRYADLRRAVPRMSEKMLTQRLGELVASGLIERRAGAYALTSRGESAKRVLSALHTWGEAVRRETGARVDTPPRAQPSRRKS